MPNKIMVGVDREDLRIPARCESPEARSCRRGGGLYDGSIDKQRPKQAGRIEMKLFHEDCPITASNFMREHTQKCTRTRRSSLRRSYASLTWPDPNPSTFHPDLCLGDRGLGKTTGHPLHYKGASISSRPLTLHLAHECHLESHMLIFSHHWIQKTCINIRINLKD